VGLQVSGVGSGVFDTASASTTQILDTFVPPIHLDLVGAELETGLIHLTMTAHSGDGLILGNVLTAMSDLFNPPLPDPVDFAQLNADLQQMLSDLNAQAPGIPAASIPPASSDPAHVLGLTVPGIDLNLLGMKLKTDAITVNTAASTGDGSLLGNLFATAFNTIDISSLGSVSANVNALMAKVVGIFNTSTLTLGAGVIGTMPPVLQNLATPTLITSTLGATASILDLNMGSPVGTAPPTSAGVMGLSATSSPLHLQLSAQTGEGNILGNILYNVANLLNPGSPSSNFLYLLELANL
jgi:hypothetical protein